MPDETWRDDLKRDVPREDIPAFLSDLQAVIATLRRYRDDLVVPEPTVLVAQVTPVIVKHQALALRYIDDPVYRDVLARALAVRQQG